MGIQIRYGMVGGHMNAFIGEVHRKAIAFDPRAQLVAGCFSTNAEKNRETGETYSLDMSRVYPSYEAMAEAESRRPDGIDFVSITTPNNTHYDVAKCFLQHGIHVVCEKPLCFTVEQAQELVALAKEKNLVFGVTYTYSGYTMMKVAREMIAEGKIGTVVSGYSQFTLWLPYEPGNWRQCKAKAGGGAMMDLSVHTIDLMEYITGMRVTEVASMNEKIAFPEPQYDVEDTSTILMRMENGAQCVVQSNFNIPDEASKWRVEFFGTKGRLLGDTMIGQIDGGKLNAVFIDKNVAYSAEQTHADDVGVEIPGDFGNMYTREIESFSDSILNNKPLVVPASDAVHVQRIMEKAYASGEELKILKI